jgi:hypothetical protein
MVLMVFPGSLSLFFRKKIGKKIGKNWAHFRKKIGKKWAQNWQKIGKKWAQNWQKMGKKMVKKI